MGTTLRQTLHLWTPHSAVLEHSGSLGSQPATATPPAAAMTPHSRSINLSVHQVGQGPCLWFPKTSPGPPLLVRHVTRWVAGDTHVYRCLQDGSQACLCHGDL